MGEAYQNHPIVVWGGPNREYRYTLWRTWDQTRPFVQFICLNPSTADETKDDPTLRRCIGYAKDWGYGAVCMTNLFAFRATKPAAMKQAADPVGPLNDQILTDIGRSAGIIVCGWGPNGTHKGRDREVVELMRGLNPHALVLTKDAHPGHPLMLEKSLKPFPLCIATKFIPV